MSDTGGQYVMAVSPKGRDSEEEEELIGRDEDQQDEEKAGVADQAKGEIPMREQPQTGIKLKSILDPCMPTAEEVKRHYLTHVPYRSWCPHCVKGRGKEMAHAT